MKKSLYTFVALSAVATLAHAQSSVTVYGTVDAGVIHVSNQPTAIPGQTGNVSALMSGGLSPNIIGFKGTEDLGDGLKAGFDLEDNFWSTTGGGQIFGGLFGRQANVSLSNTTGTLTLGKQFSPAVLAFAATDPRGLKETFSGLESWALTQSPLNTGTATTPANSNSVIDVFVANAVSLNAKFGDVNLGASYSLGGAAGSTSANSVIALGVTYTGPLLLSAAYQSDNGSDPAGGTSVQTKKYSVGAGYTLGDATVKVNYLNNRNSDPFSGIELAQYRIFGAGLDYRTSPNNGATLAYYHSNNKDLAHDTSSTLILSDDYSLSKRTTLYALIAGVKAGSAYTTGAAFGVANNSAAYLPSMGNRSTAVELGMRHTF